MLHDQADTLRQLVRQRAGLGIPEGPMAPLVVVSGGKGGVGTTTIAANLAIALARHGRRAVFVDADLDHGGNTQLSHHLHRASILDVLAGRSSVHEALERGPCGIQVLSGAWAVEDSTDCSATAQARLIGDLRNLAPHAEVVVVDAGSSRGHFARRFWHSASAVLVVTATDDASVMQGYAAIKTLLAGDASVPIHTLVNLADGSPLAGDVHARLGEACRRFLGLRTSAAGSIPFSECTGSDPVIVFPPQAESARALDRVADALWAQLQLAAGRDNTARRRPAATE
jgi:MinD-like ATPase involved in chromosome partitioning or flagellar assembly